MTSDRKGDTDMNDMIAWVKQHPVATGAIAVGGLIVIYLLFSSGGSTGDNGLAAEQQALAAQAASGNQLAALQTQLQAQSNQVAGAVSANAQNDATDLAKATLAAHTQENQDTLSAQVANNTLAAQIAAGQIAADAADHQSTAAVQINASNNGAATLTNFFDNLVQSQGGAALQHLSLQGNLTIAGAPSAFDFSTDATPFATPTTPQSTPQPSTSTYPGQVESLYIIPIGGGLSEAVPFSGDPSHPTSVGTQALQLTDVGGFGKFTPAPTIPGITYPGAGGSGAPATSPISVVPFDITKPFLANPHPSQMEFENSMAAA